MTLRQFSGFVCRCAVSAAVALAVLISAPALASAQTITLTWDPNTEANLGGYLVHSGTQSRSYSTQIDAGKQTTLPITGLDLTKDNFFAVQAYSTDGLLSPLSQEVLLPANVGGRHDDHGHQLQRGRPAPRGHASDLDGQRHEQHRCG